MKEINTNECQKTAVPAGQSTAPCYIISVSYGNDSIALIQWAHEQGLENCIVVYCNTGWSHPDWPARVKKGTKLAQKYGFIATSIRGEFTFESMVKMKKGFPSQRYQFCSGLLKVIPFNDFTNSVDPEHECIVLIGKRRGESEARKNTPEFIDKDKYHECRTVWHPLYKHTDLMRDELIKRAGFKVLPHRSMECCPCVNANRGDLRNTPERQIEKVRRLEKYINNYMFRAAKKQGATGIDEVMEWANSARGKYKHGQIRLWNYRGELCGSGLCGI